jgi:cysteine-rich repeat protein
MAVRNSSAYACGARPRAEAIAAVGRSTRLRRWTNPTLALAVWLACAPSATAATIGPLACAAAKEKAAGRHGQALLSCHAIAARNGMPVDGECLSKAAARAGAAFAKFESAWDCVTTGDAAATVDAAATDLGVVVASLGYEANAGAQRCAFFKRKAAGRHYASRLACYARGAASGRGPDPACTAKAERKLSGAFARSEARGGCSTNGDAAAILALGTAHARSRVAALSPVCGDAVAGVEEDCDGRDDDACPGLCSGDCLCANLDGCGDGVAVLPEECDDGGTDSGDGCSAFCQLEQASALCTGVAATPGTAIEARTVASGFVAPVHAAAPPLDASRLFVVEREGRIRVLRLADGSIAEAPFLDIRSLVGTNGEGGLLSMAFAPDYESSRRFFVNYTNKSGHTVIARYETSPDHRELAVAESARIVLTVAQPFANHNGGQIAFGPDGYLYVGMGDGGGGGDPLENAQNDDSLLGKMLRLDVNVDGPPYRAVPPTNPRFGDGSGNGELVWAKGLRNPWRFSFDREEGDLYLADVGQEVAEEIHVQPASSAGGENYGWDVFEGSVCHEPDPAPVCPAPPVGFTMPVHEYPHEGGPCWSVTGGFVYRGCALPDWRGTYFYSDLCQRFLRTFRYEGGAATDHQNRTADATETLGTLGTVVSFAEDARGELYVISLGGAVHRLEAD